MAHMEDPLENPTHQGYVSYDDTEVPYYILTDFSYKNNQVVIHDDEQRFYAAEGIRKRKPALAQMLDLAIRKRTPVSVTENPNPSGDASDLFDVQPYDPKQKQIDNKIAQWLPRIPRIKDADLVVIGDTRESSLHCYLEDYQGIREALQKVLKFRDSSPGAWDILQSSANASHNILVGGDQIVWHPELQKSYTMLGVQTANAAGFDLLDQLDRINTGRQVDDINGTLDFEKKLGYPYIDMNQFAAPCSLQQVPSGIPMRAYSYSRSKFHAQETALKRIGPQNFDLDRRSKKLGLEPGSEHAIIINPPRSGDTILSSDLTETDGQRIDKTSFDMLLYMQQSLEKGYRNILVPGNNSRTGVPNSIGDAHITRQVRDIRDSLLTLPRAENSLDDGLFEIGIAAYVSQRLHAGYCYENTAQNFAHFIKHAKPGTTVRMLASNKRVWDHDFIIASRSDQNHKNIVVGDGWQLNPQAVTWEHYIGNPSFYNQGITIQEKELETEEQRAEFSSIGYGSFLIFQKDSKNPSRFLLYDADSKPIKDGEQQQKTWDSEGNLGNFVSEKLRRKSLFFPYHLIKFEHTITPENDGLDIVSEAKKALDPQEMERIFSEVKPQIKDFVVVQWPPCGKLSGKLEAITGIPEQATSCIFQKTENPQKLIFTPITQDNQQFQSRIVTLSNEDADVLNNLLLNPQRASETYMQQYTLALLAVV
jgi:hypothetical protein